MESIKDIEGIEEMEDNTGNGTVKELVREILKYKGPAGHWCEMALDMDGKKINLEVTAVVTFIDNKPFGKMATPEFKLYEVWREGYACTGQCKSAIKIGEGMYKSFQEACDDLCKADPNYDSKSRSSWACSLYDNEEAARRSFG